MRETPAEPLLWEVSKAPRRKADLGQFLETRRLSFRQLIHFDTSR